MNPLQQQARRAASTLQENKQQQSRQAEKRPQRDAAPSPRDAVASAGRRGETPLAAKAQETPPHDKPRRSATRERAATADTPAMKRKPASEPAHQEASLFSQLLEGDSKPAMLMSGSTFGDYSAFPAAVEKSAQSGGAPLAVWQQLEPTLTSAMDKQPSGPVSLTLLLPKLGEVDARIAGSSGAAGWDISLRFAPQALAMLAPHHERCRASLRRRMACQVRLRFEQRGGMA